MTKKNSQITSFGMVLPMAIFLSLAFLLVLTVGCADPIAPAPAAQKSQSSAPQSGTQVANTPQSTPTYQTVQETKSKAKVGDGKKGHTYGSNMITVSGSTFWRAKEKITFEIQIPKALQLYKALNGKGPKDHQQFMKEIVKANQIKLPKLPDDHRYEYDPKTEQLMVAKPAK